MTAPGITGSGRDAVWAALRRARRCTIQDLARATKIPDDTIRDYLTGLERAGIIARDGTVSSPQPGGKVRTVFVLVEDKGVDAPRVRKDGSELPASGRARMWRNMTILGEFSVRDLVAISSLPEAKVATAEAETYCRFLALGKYLVRLPGGSGPSVRYRAVAARHTGPKPPMIRRVKELFDPNTGQVVWSKTWEDES